ncbi:MAG TPA: hypothetical protein VD838_20130, partial [Anaeromyxobacteraceae bacterium]|nr:hypothetical protein [Anaeromyxobacteraceae bacterium]
LAALRNTAIRFEADGFVSVARLRKAKLAGADYALTGQNASAVSTVLCGAAGVPCFLNGRTGHPFVAPNGAAPDPSGCLASNANVGFWYDPNGCASYHPFRVDDAQAFAGSTVAPATTRWSWWMR